MMQFNSCIVAPFLFLREVRMDSIDKNDVDIKLLFNWGKKITLLDDYGKPVISLYMRLVSDSELNRARTTALRESAKMRLALNTEDSDERLAFVPQFKAIEDENLVEAILTNEVKSITSDVMRGLDTEVLKLPVEPRSDAPLEDLEKYQKEIDDWPNKRVEAIQSLVERRLVEERKRLAGLSRKEQEEILERVIIDAHCEDTMYDTFNEMCVYFGTYVDKDYTEHAFESFEKFNELPTYFKEQLIEKYLELNLSLDDLKK